MENRYFVFDLETTGLPKTTKRTKSKYYPPEEIQYYDSSRIVSVAWMVYDKNGSVVNSSHIIVKPDGFTSSPGALKVHGITDEYATQFGTSIHDIFDELYQDLKNCNIVVGYNVKFDYNILLSECYRYHCKDIINILKKIKLNNNVICAQRESVKHIEDLPNHVRRRFYPRLEEVYRYLFNKPNFITQHDALDDTLRCAEIYFKLRDNYIKC